MIGKKFNYGWVIVGYGVLCMLLLHYGTVGSQAIFLLPVTQDLGVSTTTLTMASTYGTIVSMIVTPWAGKLMDKKSIRRLMFFGIPELCDLCLYVLCDHSGPDSAEPVCPDDAVCGTGGPVVHKGKPFLCHEHYLCRDQSGRRAAFKSAGRSY